jgi:protein-S-isoprenylcysteine O-methyltransferase Ste14
MNPYFVLVGGWVAYFAFHSFLATDRVKSKFQPRLFRVFYVLFATGGLLAMMFYSSSIHSLNFFASQGPARWVSLILTIFGVMVIQTSFRQYSLKGFVGLKEEKKELQTHGVLEYIRHPIQAGIILIVMGFFFFIPNLPTLISCLCILIYIPIGLYLEEKKLVALYGDQYIQYRKRVPAIIPDKLLKEIS